MAEQAVTGAGAADPHPAHVAAVSQGYRCAGTALGRETTRGALGTAGRRR